MEILAERGQLAASDIYEEFSSSPQAISQHLKVLREADLVRVEKQAQKRLYEINTEKVRELEEWANRTRRMWHNRLDRLEKLLKTDKAE
jgi:DNA-binding transcriptional ArsR family regulator